VLLTYEILAVQSYILHLSGRGPFSGADNNHSIVVQKGKAKHITPFVGRQLEVCEAFGFPVPENCAPKYKARKVKAKGPGRSPKPKVITEEG
jgi:hypothetical protein